MASPTTGTIHTLREDSSRRTYSPGSGPQKPKPANCRECSPDAQSILRPSSPFPRSSSMKQGESARDRRISSAGRTFNRSYSALSSPSGHRPSSGRRNRSLQKSRSFGAGEASPIFREVAMTLMSALTNQMTDSLSQVVEQLVALHERSVLAVPDRPSQVQAPPEPVAACDEEQSNAASENYLEIEDSEVQELGPQTIAPGEADEDGPDSGIGVRFASIASMQSLGSSETPTNARTAGVLNTDEQPHCVQEEVEAPTSLVQPPSEFQSVSLDVRPPCGEPVELSILPQVVHKVTSVGADIQVVDTEPNGEVGLASKLEKFRSSRTLPTLAGLGLDSGSGSVNGCPGSAGSPPGRVSGMPVMSTSSIISPRSSALQKGSLHHGGWASERTGELETGSADFGVPSPRSSALDPNFGNPSPRSSALDPNFGNPSPRSSALDPNWAMKRTVKAVMAVSKLGLPIHKQDTVRTSCLSGPPTRSDTMRSDADWADDMDSDMRRIKSASLPASRADSRRMSVASSVMTAVKDRRRSSVRRPSSIHALATMQSETGENSQMLQAARFTVREVWEARDEEELLTQKCFYSLQDESNRRTLNKSLRKKLSSASVGSHVQKFRCKSDQVPLHPEANCRVAWELLTLILIGFDIIVIPLHFIGPLDSPPFQAVTWMGRIVWTCDIFMSFATGTYVNGALDMRPWRVAKNYASTWLLFDICLVLQEWLSLTGDAEQTGGSSGMSLKLDNFSAVRTFRLLRFLRLLRLLKAGFMISDMIERFNSTSFVLFCDIVKSIFGLVIINHIVACLWYGIGDTEEGWVHLEINEMLGTSFANRYLTSLHWSLTNFSGSTEIFPRTASERFFAVFIVLLALILFSSFLGNLTNTMMELQELQHERYQQQRILRRFLRENNISSMLSVRVKKYLLGIAVEDQRHGQVQKALTTLPIQLLMDIHDESRGPLIAAHQFFCDLRAQHPRLLRQICHYALMDVNTTVNETTFAVGDACTRMFFLMEGTMQYELKRTAQSPAGLKRKNSNDPQAFLRSLSRGNSSLTQSLEASQGLSDKHGKMADAHTNSSLSQSSLTKANTLSNLMLGRGQWISEAGLWTKWEHCGNFSTVGPSARYLAMDADKFAAQVKNFENAYLFTKRYAMLFVEYMNSDIQCTDLLEFDRTLQEFLEGRESMNSNPIVGENSVVSVPSSTFSSICSAKSKFAEFADRLKPFTFYFQNPMRRLLSS